jgi:hypothetical protein
MRWKWLLPAVCLFLTACAAASLNPTPTSLPVDSAPAVEPQFQSRGGGEPRTAGYWLLWNACAEDNKSETAAANGGRDAGWVILDDLLVDPGILVGELPVETCEQGIHLLQGMDLNGQQKAEDAAYALAYQLLSAQLNMAAGAEYCPAIDEAIQSSQLLLLSLDFDGTGDYLELLAEGDSSTLARNLVNQLAAYNIGELCR